MELWGQELQQDFSVRGGCRLLLHASATASGRKTSLAGYTTSNAEAPTRFSQRARPSRRVLSDSLLTNQTRSVAEASRSRDTLRSTLRHPTSLHSRFSRPARPYGHDSALPSPYGAGVETAPIPAPRRGMNHNCKLRGTPELPPPRT